MGLIRRIRIQSADRLPYVRPVTSPARRSPNRTHGTFKNTDTHCGVTASASSVRGVLTMRIGEHRWSASPASSAEQPRAEVRTHVCRRERKVSEMCTFTHEIDSDEAIGGLQMQIPTWKPSASSLERRTPPKERLPGIPLPSEQPIGIFTLRTPSVYPNRFRRARP